MHGICFIIACQKHGFCLKFLHIVFLLTSYSALSLLIFWFCSNECWNIFVGNKCCKGEIFFHVYCFRYFKWSKHALFQPWSPGSWVRSFGVRYSVILSYFPPDSDGCLHLGVNAAFPTNRITMLTETLCHPHFRTDGDWRAGTCYRFCFGYFVYHAFKIFKGKLWIFLRL